MRHGHNNVANKHVPKGLHAEFAVFTNPPPRNAKNMCHTRKRYTRSGMLVTFDR